MGHPKLRKEAGHLIPKAKAPLCLWVWPYTSSGLTLHLHDIFKNMDFIRILLKFCSWKCHVKVSTCGMAEHHSEWGWGQISNTVRFHLKMRCCLHLCEVWTRSGLTDLQCPKYFVIFWHTWQTVPKLKMINTEDTLEMFFFLSSLKLELCKWSLALHVEAFYMGKAFWL